MGWYAYDENTIFLPSSRGEFTIRLGDRVDSLTHLTSLPMRAELISVSGNGAELEFVFRGEGKIVAYLNVAAGADFAPVGADSTVLRANLLEMIFDDCGVHTGRIVLTSAMEK